MHTTLTEVNHLIDQLETDRDLAGMLDEETILDRPLDEHEPLDLYLLACDLLACSSR